MKVGPWTKRQYSGWLRRYENGGLAAEVGGTDACAAWATYAPSGALMWKGTTEGGATARDRADAALRLDGHDFPHTTETSATSVVVAYVDPSVPSPPTTARAVARAARRDRQAVFAAGVAHGKRHLNARGRLRGDAAVARVLGSERLLWPVVDALRRGAVPNDARYLRKYLVRGLTDDELLAELAWRERLREWRAAKTARGGRLGAFVSRWAAAATEAVRILAGRAP